MVRRGSADERDFVKRLRIAREEAGLTQREVARRLGRSQSYVCKAENGEQRVDVVELRNFCRIYEKPPAYFFGAEWHVEQRTPAASRGSSPLRPTPASRRAAARHS